MWIFFLFQIFSTLLLSLLVSTLASPIEYNKDSEKENGTRILAKSASKTVSHGGKIKAASFGEHDRNHNNGRNQQQGNGEWNDGYRRGNDGYRGGNNRYRDRNDNDRRGGNNPQRFTTSSSTTTTTAMYDDYNNYRNFFTYNPSYRTTSTTSTTRSPYYYYNMFYPLRTTTVSSYDYNNWIILNGNKFNMQYSKMYVFN